MNSDEWALAVVKEANDNGIDNAEATLDAAPTGRRPWQNGTRQWLRSTCSGETRERRQSDDCP